VAGFKKFLLRGNVVDLAIAVMIGAAFGAVVSSFTSGIITPLIAAIGGEPNFSALHFTVHHSTFRYGLFINAVVAFVILAAILYFLVVLPINTLMERFKPTPEEPAPTRDCPHCVSSIPQAATVCAFCTRDVPPSAASSART
jgi:large conductance mechanosensitive channel